jgi:hypothetical protein
VTSRRAVVVQAGVVQVDDAVAPRRGQALLAPDPAAASEGGQVPIRGESVGCDRGVMCPLMEGQVPSIGG